MDYKERYEQALENIKRIKAANKDNKELVDFIEYEYPELKESEDERIRKAVIEFVKQNNSFTHCKGVSKDDCLAWLEKQGEQEPVTDFSDLRTWKYIVDAVLTEKDGIGQYIDSPFTKEVAKKLQKRFGNIEQSPTEKIEPKFKVGDWIVNNNGEPRVFRVEKQDWPDSIISSSLGNQFINTFTLDKQYHLWTIQDAKSGDVLSFDNECSNYHSIGIFKRIASKNEPNGNTYRCYVRYGGFKKELEIPVNGGELHHCGTSTRPATKEQRDLLFSKMKEAGYKWDAEKKELKKIEQTSAWSEEDENEFKWICVKLQEHHMSLEYTERVRKAMSWLKSLKERYTWKPSEEQMEALRKAIDEHFDIDGDDLWHLYEDLKELMEE